MRVGVAGLGRMGTAIAERLKEVGRDLVVWTRSPEKTKPLADAVSDPKIERRAVHFTDGSVRCPGRARCERRAGKCQPMVEYVPIILEIEIRMMRQIDQRVVVGEALHRHEQGLISELVCD